MGGKMVGARKGAAAEVARVRFGAGVLAQVAGELVAAGEAPRTGLEGALERPLARVRADVRLEMRALDVRLLAAVVRAHKRPRLGRVVVAFVRRRLVLRESIWRREVGQGGSARMLALRRRRQSEHLHVLIKGAVRIGLAHRTRVLRRRRLHEHRPRHHGRRERVRRQLAQRRAEDGRGHELRGQIAVHRHEILKISELARRLRLERLLLLLLMLLRAQEIVVAGRCMRKRRELHVHRGVGRRKKRGAVARVEQLHDFARVEGVQNGHARRIQRGRVHARGWRRHQRKLLGGEERVRQRVGDVLKRVPHWRQRAAQQIQHSGRRGLVRGRCGLNLGCVQTASTRGVCGSGKQRAKQGREQGVAAAEE
eukprot:m.909705 g.909705  ORF g.909705 m.909705 type:complete len:367 (-) comp60108_c0_seq66:2661-3761(-)